MSDNMTTVFCINKQEETKSAPRHGSSHALELVDLALDKLLSSTPPGRNGHLSRQPKQAFPPGLQVGAPFFCDAVHFLAVGFPIVGPLYNPSKQEMPTAPEYP